MLALFDVQWDEQLSSFMTPDDPNTYSTGAIGAHNVVLVYMPSMGKAHAATVAAHCRSSFPNIKLAIVVGICGAVPFVPESKAEIVLGDVIISEAIIQHDFGQQLPDQFVRKNRILDALGRPDTRIRSLLTKLKLVSNRRDLRRKMIAYLETLRRDPDLEAQYPGVTYDRLFEAAYCHRDNTLSCDECQCSGKLVARHRLMDDDVQPVIHFGLVASGDTVMKSGEERDAIAKQENVLCFEMESAGVWDTFPCVVIKSACDYADSHKTKAWQRYAAATAAACTKAFLEYWKSSAAPGEFLY
jgi:nucleoside phosphorylase